MLYITLILIGLTAIDPIGLGSMPLLLSQKQPYKRCAVFLSGSMSSMIIMGLLFAKGLGRAILRFEHRNHWLVPSVGFTAAAILFILAGVIYWQLRSGKQMVEPGEKTRKWLALNSIHLFLLGLLVVAGQSVIDVVFIVVMIRVGQLRIPDIELVGAVLTYAVAALASQIAIVLAFRLAPEDKKAKLLKTVHTLLYKYSYRVIFLLSLVIGSAMLGFGMHAVLAR